MKDEYKPKEESNSRLVTSFRSFFQFPGIFVALVGGAVLIGWITFASTPGVGTTFTVTLPRSIIKESEPSLVKEYQAPGPSKGLKAFNLGIFKIQSG